MTQANGNLPLDMAVLEALFGDDLELRLGILDEFCAVTITYLQEFQAAQDPVAIGAVAHKLKSSARTIGAHPLADICAGLESAGRNGQQAIIDQLLPRLEPEIRRVADFVAALERA